MTIDLGNNIIIDIGQLYKTSMPGSNVSKEQYFEYLKTLPGDELLLLDSMKEVYGIDPGKGGSEMQKGGILRTSLDPAINLHEDGHYKDNLAGVGSHGISTNPELIEIYNKEMENFNNEHSRLTQEVVKYFGQTSPANISGLSEIIAEMNYLRAIYGLATQESLQARGEFLVRYFPETTAKVMELLEAEDKKTYDSYYGTQFTDNK